MMPPVAIPTKGREDKLCCQTLATLQRYHWDMSKVHVFVDPVARRSDGTLEHDCYWKRLQHGDLAKVQLHPGGSGLCEQYNRIFEFFAGVTRVLIMSDTVPKILNRRKRSLLQDELPLDDFKPLVALAFDLCQEMSVRAWSLGPCKSPRNMRPGAISLKCGLLDGNCFGVDLSRSPPLSFEYSGYTTDVEFSVKAWDADGGMIRFLGISAEHAYRSAGGHVASTGGPVSDRVNLTNQSIQSLAKAYPTLLKYCPSKSISDRGMKYRFLPKGPSPMTLFGSYNLRGAPTKFKTVPMTDTERCRKFRGIPAPPIRKTDLRKYNSGRHRKKKSEVAMK